MWVFGYGSLIWNPGFEYDRKEIAQLFGYQRSFCMRSIHHRGTPEEPGLVLALDQLQSASCTGVAFHVPDQQKDETLLYLRDRELISSAYLEENLSITLQTGTVHEAVTYVIDAQHVQYCGGLAMEEQAQIISYAEGGRGFNRDYLYQTVAKLDELAIADTNLTWLANRVRGICAAHT